VIARRTPLRRTPMRRSKTKTSYAKRPRFRDYMLFVKRLPCSAIAIDADSKCEGPIEADHAGRRGIGQKAHDSTVIPMCSKHHRERHSFSGAFKTWDQDKMRTWLAQRVWLTQRIAMGRGVVVPKEAA
jgi:hypothetical protein